MVPYLPFKKARIGERKAIRGERVARSDITYSREGILGK
jgi:hypothetical protein